MNQQIDSTELDAYITGVNDPDSPIHDRVDEDFVPMKWGEIE